MDRSAVVVQVIAMLGTILALVGVGAFGEALNTLLLLQNLLTIAIAYDRYNKSQSKHYFLRKDLLFPLDSPYWKVLNNEGSEYGYRVLLRTNKAAFDLICGGFPALPLGSLAAARGPAAAAAAGRWRPPPGAPPSTSPAPEPSLSTEVERERAFWRIPRPISPGLSIEKPTEKTAKWRETAVTAAVRWNNTTFLGLHL